MPLHLTKILNSSEVKAMLLSETSILGTSMRQVHMSKESDSFSIEHNDTTATSNHFE